MSQKTFVFILLIFLFAIAGFILFQELKKEDKDIFQGLRVGASFYPLADFAQEVGGGQIQVRNFTPGGADPHAFEPTPRDLIALFELDVFIFVGTDFEPWAEGMEDELKEKGVRLLKVSDIITFKPLEEEHEEENDHDHGEYDPHFWLNPLLAIKTIEAIRNIFIEMDEENEETYLKNAAEYLEKLVEIDKKYRQGLAECQLEEIIVSHNAFSYLGARYNIEIHAIAGLSHDEEPSPKRMAELSFLAREKSINYIFFETLADPRLAETIAREAGAKTLVLNPIEGLTPQEESEGKNYLKIMEENLEALRLALSCQ